MGTWEWRTNVAAGAAGAQRFNLTAHQHKPGFNPVFNFIFMPGFAIFRNTAGGDIPFGHYLPHCFFLYVAVLLAQLQQPGADKSGFDLCLAAIGDLA